MGTYQYLWWESLLPAHDQGEPFGKQPTPEQKRKAFIKDFITGWAAGPFLANMDRFERHAICEHCGTKVIEE